MANKPGLYDQEFHETVFIIC